MMPFTARKENLRDKAIECIDQYVSLKKHNLGSDLYGYLENNGESQKCTVKSIEKVGEQIFINHIGELNESDDYTDVKEVSTDLLCNIADRLHFEPLNKLK